MTFLELIQQDHKKVQQTLEKLEHGRGGKTRERDFSKLLELLLPHMHAEEQMFYPLLREEADAKLADEAEEEHIAVRKMLSDLEMIDFEHHRWSAKITVIAEMIRHHIKEEEGDIFKQARKIIDKQRDQALTRQFKSAKQQAAAVA